MKFNKMLAITGMMFASGVSQFAQAQAEKIGNGGDAVVCNGGKDIYLLDYLEAEQRGIKITTTKNEQSVRKILEEVMQSWAKKVDSVSEFSELLEKMIGDVEKHELNQQKYGEVISFVSGELADVPDSLELVLNEGCFREQLVIQQTPKFTEDRIFLIRESLWNKMDQFQRAMTLLHEVIYKKAISKHKAKDSRSTRYLNSLAMSDGFEAMSVCEWSRKTRAASMSIQYGGETILGKETCSLDGTLKSAEIKKSLSSIKASINATFIHANGVSFKDSLKKVDFYKIGESSGFSYSDFKKNVMKKISMDIDPTQSFFCSHRKFVQVSTVKVLDEGYLYIGRLMLRYLDSGDAQGCGAKDLNEEVSHVFGGVK